MPETPLQGLAPTLAQAGTSRRFIYMACPWSPMGGGMYRVVDYLVQSQSQTPAEDDAQLCPLDSRGPGSSVWSMAVLAGALARIVKGRLGGRLSGVHVNMAERLSLVRKGLMLLLCRMIGIPTVLHLHAAQLHHNYRALPRPAQWAVRRLFALPSCCIVLGRSAADFVIGELRVPPERVEIVINGVPPPRIARRRQHSGAVQRILFVGNLSERKGVSDLLQALAHPALASLPFEATFAGGGDVAHYRARAESLGLGGTVRFEGWSDQAKVAALLSQADVLVLPSYDEGLPLAILEALAHGVAVVCTPVGEIPNVLTDGVDACFVRPGDAVGIAQALARVLKEPHLREALEHNGRLLYEEKFSLSRFFTRVADIHQRHFGVSGRAASGADHPAKAPTP